MERKYKTICEGLDNGDNKKALQECDKLLRKFETKKQDKIDIKFIQALKCLSLCRLGKRSDAVDVLKILLAEKPSDIDVVQVMQTVCKELRLYETLATMLENAIKANPSEEILSNLFMACVVNNDYKRQQQVALKLHQACPEKNNYYFWSVASIVMQAISEPKLAKAIYLPLAEKFCFKFIQENRISAENEIILYLDILKRQENYSQAIKFLTESPLVQTLDEINYRQTRLAEFHYLKGNWSESCDLYQKLLLNHPDQWLFWDRMIDSGLRLCKENDDSKLSAILASINDARTNKSGGNGRACLLAPLQLILLSKQLNVCTDKLCDLSPKDLFKAYLAHYSNRTCAWDDLMLYLPLLEKGQLKEIYDDALASCTYFQNALANGSAKNSGDDVAKEQLGSKMMMELQEIITYEALLFHESSDRKDKQLSSERVDHMKLALEKYKSFCEKHEGSALAEMDYRPGDKMIILTASGLLRLYQITKSEAYLYEAGDLLFSLPNNNYYKQLLLVILFNMFGAGLHAFLVFTKLDIKHIQFETLSYLVLAVLSQVGPFKQYSALLEACLHQNAMSGVEFSHVVPLAYHYGTFTKIPEMVELQQRLRSSVDFFQHNIERMLFDLTIPFHEDIAALAVENLENLSKDRIPWNNLVLLRDYAPLSTCFLNTPSDDDCAQLLALQKLILRCSVAEAKLVSICACRPNMEEVTSVGSELINLAHEVVSETSKVTDLEKLWPLSSYLSHWAISDVSHLPARCLLLNSVARLSARIISGLANCENSDRDPFEHPMIEEMELIHDIESQLRELTSQLKPDQPSAENQSSTLRHINGCVRTLCEISLCLILSVERLRFVKAYQTKLAKKKKDVSLNSNFYEVHNEFIKNLKDSVESCNSLCHSMQEKFGSFAAQHSAKFRGHIFESWSTQLQEFSDRLTRLASFNLTVKLFLGQ